MKEVFDWMSKVDDIFIKDLIAISREDEEIDNRAKWEDGSQVKTKRVLQVVNKYDLSEGFPILSLRSINWKAAIDEIIWIMIEQSNNIKDLNSKIWDSWADDEGVVQKSYGYQIAKETMGHPSQLHYVINEIKTNPTSRRIMMNMFSASEQHEKGLIECAYATHFSVKDGKLHMTLLQRSGDFLTACGFGGFNTIQYSFLQHAIAKECGLEVGVFTHFVQDLHLYNKHETQSEMLFDRYWETAIDDNNSSPVSIRIADKPIFDLTVEDVELIGYEHLGGIGKIEVAV